MSKLEIKGLYKNYPEGGLITEVLKDINLEINQGEFVLITGPSGSGKTTLLNCISGLETVTEGGVYLDGVDFSKFSKKQMAELRKTKIGFVFQQYNLLPNLTLFENIQIACVIAGKNDTNKINTLLEKFNLLEFKKHFPNQVSGGMQQRTAIVRALINDPEIIFADEPTGNLDSKSTVEVMENFKYLHQEYKKTIIMVTHSLDNLKYATRHIKIIDGKVVLDEQINA